MNKALQVMTDALPVEQEQTRNRLKSRKEWQKQFSELHAFVNSTVKAFDGIRGLRCEFAPARFDELRADDRWALTYKTSAIRVAAEVQIWNGEKGYQIAWAMKALDDYTRPCLTNVEDFEEVFGKAMAKRIVEIQVENGSINV